MYQASPNLYRSSPELSRMRSGSGAAAPSYRPCCFGLLRERKMTARESLSLSTWQKWSRYGRVPWKFILNFLLVVTTSTIIISESETDAPYTRSAITSWQYLLQPSAAAGFTGASQQFGYRTVYYLYKVSTFLASMEKARNSYFNIQEYAVDHFNFTRTSDGRVAPIMMDVTTYTQGQAIFDIDKSFSDATETVTYPLYSAADVGPFDKSGAALVAFVHTLRRVTLAFDVENFEIHSGERTCFLWKVEVVYDMGVRGRVDQSVRLDQDLCASESDVYWFDRGNKLAVVMLLITLVVATISQVLHVKAIANAIRIFQRVKRKSYAAQRFGREASSSALTPHLAERLSWNNLSFADKMKFFNLWFFTATIGNICNIVAPCIRIEQIVRVKGSAFASLDVYFTGLGCMMAWISMVQYFEETTTYYVLITTLKKGTPRVGRFLVGVMPVFLGYAMFGVAFFSTSAERFATLDAACVTLFSLLNGDVIHDVFDELHPAHPIISRIYLYSFISLFIYAVLNIFIAIIEDAFFASKAFQEQQARESEKLDLKDMDPLDLVDVVLPTGPLSSDEKDHDDDDDDGHREVLMDDSPNVVIDRTVSESMVVPLLSNEAGGDEGHSPRDERRGGAGGGGGAGASTPVTRIVDMLADMQDVFMVDFKKQVKAAIVESAGKQRQRRAKARIALTAFKAPADGDPRPGQLVASSSYQPASSAVRFKSPSSSVSSSSSESSASSVLGDDEAEAGADADADKKEAPAAVEKKQDGGPQAFDMPSIVSEVQVSATPMSAREVEEELARVLIRPPHDPSAFPCGFDDCLHCGVRAVYAEALGAVREKVTRKMDALLSAAAAARRRKSHGGGGGGGAEGGATSSLK